MQNKIGLNFTFLGVLSFLFGLCYSQVSIICSAACPIDSCSPTIFDTCSSCDSHFTSNTSAFPTCQPKPTDGYISLSGTTITPTGSTLPCGVNSNIKGWFDTSESISISHPAITRTFTGIELIIVLVTTGTGWIGNEEFNIKFDNTGFDQVVSISSIDNIDGLCTTSPSDTLYRIRQEIAYNTQSLSLGWTISINNPGATNADWGYSEAIILLKACKEGCKTCPTSSIVCTSCETIGSTEYFLDTDENDCVISGDCPDKTYPDTTTYICEDCSANCLTCISGTECTVCETSYFLDTTDETCVSTCSSGYFGDSSATPPTCVLCDTECSKCSSLGNNCSECKSGYYLLGNTCHSTCPEPNYESTSPNVCLSCHVRCTACSTSATNCSGCQTSGADESYLDSAADSCVLAASCPSGTYAESSGHTCSTCTSPCQLCSGTSGNCTECISTHYLLGNTCYSTCPEPNYESTSPNVCLSCHVRCTACSTSATNCSGCQTSGADESFLDSASDSCVLAASCPSGTYAETSGHTCSTCTSPCQLCSGTSGNCTECISTHYLLGNTCYSTCPEPNYESTSPNVCLSCHVRCTACSTSATNCSGCQTSGADESFLDSASDSCVLAASCPSGTYAESSGHTCSTCTSPCQLCSGTSGNCTECISTHYLLGNTCYSTCPEPNYESTSPNVCLSCHVRCTACSTSATNCSGCQTSGADESYLDSAADSCVLAASCPSGTFPDPGSHECVTCQSPCETCSGSTTNCTSCVIDYFYLANVCHYLNCPIRNYESAPAIKQCLPCNVSCVECEGSASNCSVCEPTLPNEAFLVNATNQCVSSTACPSGSFPETVTHICWACNVSCSTCTGNMDNCTACTNPLFLLTNICYTICPIDYYGASGLCVACHTLCSNCTGTAVNQCIACKTVPPNEAFFLSTNTTCYVNCPIGYFKVFADHTCAPCHISCSQCTNNPTPCQACNVSYSYLNSTCYNPCPDGYYSGSVANQSYNNCKPCNEVCLTCYGGFDYQCNTCNYDYQVKKSGSTCREFCVSGWGDTNSNDVCVYCNTRCVSCYQSQHNCSSCRTSGGNEGFMVITDIIHGTGRCYQECLTGTFANISTHMCDPCASSCLNCSKISTNCTVCPPGLYFLNFTCLVTCPDGYFANGTNCSLCNWRCLTCTNTATNCSLCKPSIPAYHLNNVCYSTCPNGYYGKLNTTINNTGTCEQCDPSCLTCSNTPTYCFTCIANYYWFNYDCNDSCTTDGYFGDQVTWTCMECDIGCVRLSLAISYFDILEESIVVKFSFSENIDWTTFPKETFQIFSFSDSFYSIDMFDLVYTVVNSKTYTIKISPRLYIFMYNVLLRVTVIEKPNPNLNSLNLRPFHDSVFSQTASITWSTIKAPGITETEKQILSEIKTFTSSLQQVTNSSGVREIVQSGVFAWIFPGVQITSATILVNGIMPQHMYEGIRLMASFIFYQVPSWEKNADNYRYIFDEKIENLLPMINNRKLQTSDISENSIPAGWRFKRTGFSTFFLLDIYMQLILIGAAWLILLITTKVIFRSRKTHPMIGKVYILFHKIHEISLMYLTIGMLLEWVYFNEQNDSIYKWSSFFVCLIILVYFLVYQLYIYYDLFQYPEAHINTRSYLVYSIKYGHFLSKIRYEEYEIMSDWSPRVWIRPYNYHVLSFYKKFMMMLVLPIFDKERYSQISCLIVLQIFEMIRFYLTWPFNSRVRNIIRFALELMLLVIFVVVLICQKLSSSLMSSSQEEIPEIVKWFNLSGWIGLILVVIYNLSILLIFLVDVLMMCFVGDSMKQMDDIRKNYYWEKVKKYEDENEDINVNVICKWVKLGNLREEANIHDECRFVTVKIEKLRIEREKNFFTVNATHVNDLRIKREGFIHEENCRRLFIKDKLKRIIEIEEGKHKELYKILNDLYFIYNVNKQFLKAKGEEVIPLFEKARLRDCYEVVVETYVKIDLDEYPEGGRVLFKRNMIKHVINLYLNEKKVMKIKEEKAMNGFPLDKKYLDQDLYLKN